MSEVCARKGCSVHRVASVAEVCARKGCSVRRVGSVAEVCARKGCSVRRVGSVVMCALFFGRLNIYFFDSGTKQAERAFRLSSRSLL